MAATSRPDTASELHRLEVLHRYAILDTAAEPAFDELVERTARECGYPTALITLMDATRCWFKATAGIPSSYGKIREIAREQTFCNYAFRSSGIFIVTDAREDERFQRLRIVDRPDGFRAYAGAQLITPEGHSIGTLSVLDTAPRTPTAAQVDALRALATRVMALIETRHHDRATAPASALTSEPRPEPSVHIAPPTIAGVPTRPLVLVVDDEELIRGVTASMVTRLGCETRMAANGQEALERVAALGGRVRLVITDIHMPVMNGVDLIRALRTQPHPPAMAATSGRFTPEIRAQLQAEGVTHLIAKPFGMAEIDAVLKATFASLR